MPAGLALFPNELFKQPKSMAKHKYPNLVQYSKLAEGGHFAAFEVPEVLHEDFVKFVAAVEKLGTQKAGKTEL